MTTPMDKLLLEARKNIESINATVDLLTQYRDTATAQIGEFLRTESGLQLDEDAIRATVRRPYTILPINEHEAWLIHWRGIRGPIFGWVVAQEPAFIKAKVTRTMDLLTPMPAFLKEEMGWRDPDHKAVIDGTRTGIRVTDGDEATFKKRYGQHLGSKNPDGSWKIKGGDSWINLVASLVRDGILPYTPQPVDGAHWQSKVTYNKRLREIIDEKQEKAGYPYIDNAVDEFRNYGAVLLNIPPGSGKTLTTCAVFHHFSGDVLVLADSVMLVDQWRDRVKELAPGTPSNITFSTYQGAAKYLNKKWDLIVWDEAQRLPANTFSKLAFAQTLYRLGLTGSAWREDNRQNLIVALSGKPVAIRWAALVSTGVLKRPEIVVATVPSEAAKVPFVKSLIAKRKGRTMIFCDWIEQGQALADYLGVPFVHGETKDKLERVREAEVCVVSRIGDRGVSFPDLRLVIEVAGAGAAREQFAQRVGRLLHGEFHGKFVTVFNPQEASKYRGRVFGVEAELAGEVDIEFITVGEMKEPTKSARPIPKKSESVRRAVEEPKDEIAKTLAVSSIAAKIKAAQKKLNQRASAYVPKVMRFCWSSSLSVQDIMDALGINNDETRRNIRAACEACVGAGLMAVSKSITYLDSKYYVSIKEIERLKKLQNLKGI